MTRLVVATRNPHKLTEVRRILRGAGLDELELVGLNELAGVPEVAETGRTFADNALLKARSAAAATGTPALADDSGICVDLLAGMPGVRSARWAGLPPDDAANLRLLLAQLSDVTGADRAATFVAAVALVLPDGREAVEEGRVQGTLAREPRGTDGFGYDPAFVPDGETRTTAELSPAEKDALSHRGRALRRLAPTIEALLGVRRKVAARSTMGR